MFDEMIAKRIKERSLCDRWCAMFDEMIAKRINLCDRCDTPHGGEVRVSWYNAQTICLLCAKEERERPDWSACRLAEMRAVVKGDYNYNFLPAWKVTRK
jgi:hypothetical protein